RKLIVFPSTSIIATFSGTGDTKICNSPYKHPRILTMSLELANTDLNRSSSVFFYYEDETCIPECTCKKRKREDEKKNVSNEQPVLILLDSDEEDEEIQQSPSSVLQESIQLPKQDEELPSVENIIGKDAKGEIDIGDMWKEMNIALEVSLNALVAESPNEDTKEAEQLCDHSYILKDDIGYVCRVCGIIDIPIDTILDIQYKKPSSSRRYYPKRGGKAGGEDNENIKPLNFSAHKISHPAEICAHPKHWQVMKPHQIEGFNFLHSNLMDNENPGGCILAHAPGSGKTFMIISFVQSFLAKYPDGRPLVVLPKGILSTWKKEFQKWQIEDIPLLDFYSVKAENRKLQLEILMSWKEKKSILFLGYKQFSTIVTDNRATNASKNCQELLLHLPSILIMDEGHTPRNKETEIVRSLAMVKTPRKVILSGTLYQNNVKEVFTVLDLVRPKFMKLESSSLIKKRIMTYVNFSGFKKHLNGKGDAPFYDLVENTLQQDEDSNRKAAIIRDLRELTSKVLHYYKGDFLDELPGLVDFTVLLKLTPRQKLELKTLNKAEKMHFRKTAQGSLVYVHPKLKQFSHIAAASGENSALVNDENVDQLLEDINIQDGVKAKFVLAMLGLCEAANEKLLVFGQYLLPLKFLERLIVHKKGWKLGKEIFMICGDTSTEQREWSMERFNSSPDAKVFFGSIKACGEGISLVGASRIIILDVHVNPSVSRQALGRAFRPGQLKKVYTYRLVAADSPEEEDHAACYKKELIAKRWFEWNDYDVAKHNSHMEEVDLKDSGDIFMESPSLNADVKLLQRSKK
ncbi:hypothetical protein V2J09_020085, partial [Rumex salicifolius]